MRPWFASQARLRARRRVARQLYGAHIKRLRPSTVGARIPNDFAELVRAGAWPVVHGAANVSQTGGADHPADQSHGGVMDAQSVRTGGESA